jgi:hypothetical protein
MSKFSSLYYKRKAFEIQVYLSISEKSGINLGVVGVRELAIKGSLVQRELSPKVTEGL